MAEKKLGEILIENDVISQVTLDQALRKQKYSHKPIGQILAEMDMILEEDIAQGLSTQFKIPYLKKFSHYDIPQEVLDKIAAGCALSKQVFPLKIEHKTLILAMANPLDINLQQELSFQLAMRITPVIATPEEIKTAIEKHYLSPLAAESGRQGQVVLHIDSHEPTLTTAEKVLHKEGFTVHKASDGSEGLKLAALLQPQVIITEVRLPKLDSKALLKALEENRNTADIPVIVLTARASAEDEYRLLEMGFFDVLAKPLEPTRLVARVKRAVRFSARRFQTRAVQY